MAEQAVLPYLLYEDGEAAVRFLTEAFGFEIGDHYMTDGDGRVNHADLRLGDASIMLGVPAGGGTSPNAAGGATVLVCVFVGDVDAHYAHAVAAGATIDSKPEDKPYGWCTYGATDPQGHKWWFNQVISEPPEAST
ncbi:MAG: VOC family protein [Streptosporangiales bacterium]